MTKTARDRFLPTGPKQNHPAQLYDISGDRMVLLKDFPTIGEPHYAQAIEASKLMPNVKKIYSLENNNHPHAIKRTQDARVEREGNKVRVYMAHIRSHQNAGQHRGDPGGRHGLLPPHQRGAGLGRGARLRDQGDEHRRGAGRARARRRP
jgi:hypothetical protein